MLAVAIRDLYLPHLSSSPVLEPKDFLSSLLCILQMILQKLLDCMQRFLQRVDMLEGTRKAQT